MWINTHNTTFTLLSIQVYNSSIESSTKRLKLPLPVPMHVYELDEIDLQTTGARTTSMSIFAAMSRRGVSDSYIKTMAHSSHTADTGDGNCKQCPRTQK